MRSSPSAYLHAVFGLSLTICCDPSSAAVSGQGIGPAYESYFGIIVTDHEGEEFFEVTDTVPLVEGQTYGWMIKLGPGINRVRWKEVFELPEAPQSWGAVKPGDGNSISEDRRTSITEEEVFIEHGIIDNYWSVAVGDPRGDYIIRVYINDRLAETFRFVVGSEY